jgi:hypothetical protein
MVAALAVSMVAALWATPVLGQSDDGVQVAAASGNAHRVDGKHAVGFGASVASRSGKLVATSNDTGLLPSDIILPLWSLLQGVPAGFADGIDNGTFVSTATGNIAVGAGGVVFPAFVLNRNVEVEFFLVPQTVGQFMAIQEVLTVLNADNTLTHYVQIKNYGVASTFRLRLRVTSEGITPASLKRQLKASAVKVYKKAPWK